MVIRSALALAFAAASVSTLVAQKNPQNGQKLNDVLRRETQSAVQIVDDVAAGKPAPNDLSLLFVREDLFKAQNNKEYVPFVVTIDSSKVSGGSVSVYWRVVSKAVTEAPPPAAPPASGKKGDKAAPPPRPVYAYEDYGTLSVVPGQGSIRINRSFTVAAGDYDLFVVVKEPTSDKKDAPAPKMSVIKQPITVSDFWNGNLSTSSVMVAERIDPLPAPLTPKQQIERPYALGGLELIPVADTKFSKNAELSTFLLVYNAKNDSANKPNVTVEYSFYAKQPGAEKFFNKTPPQGLNAQTLPSGFDVAAGDQLQSFQAVPLASFPAGDYRLEIKVTDNMANKSVTRNVNFSVSGS